MALKKEAIQQTTTGTWAASGSVNLLLDRIGLVTRYDVTAQITPSATLATNQPDGLFRPMRNLTIAAGSATYFTLPDDAGGFGGTLLHYLNLIDKLGMGHRNMGAITAPDTTYLSVTMRFHAGIRPQRRDGIDQPFDLSAFVPVGIESSPQLTWTTGPNSVMDDAVTISSAVLVVKPHRVLGTTQEIRQEMANQGVEDILNLIRTGAEGVLANPGCVGLTPSWYAQVQSPTATWPNYGLELDSQLGGFIKRVSFIAQDETGTRPVRASDELTQLKMFVPEANSVLFSTDTESINAAGPSYDEPGIDGVADFFGGAPKGVYVKDLRPFGPTQLEQLIGYDTRGRQNGYLKFGQTIGANAAGDDIGVLTERYHVYTGLLSNMPYP